jgi:hypothetical protein
MVPSIAWDIKPPGDLQKPYFRYPDSLQAKSILVPLSACYSVPGPAGVFIFGED